MLDNLSSLLVALFRVSFVAATIVSFFTVVFDNSFSVRFTFVAVVVTVLLIAEVVLVLLFNNSSVDCFDLTRQIFSLIVNRLKQTCFLVLFFLKLEIKFNTHLELNFSFFFIDSNHLTFFIF